jgi:hypothetical protein
MENHRRGPSSGRLLTVSDHAARQDCRDRRGMTQRPLEPTISPPWRATTSPPPAGRFKARWDYVWKDHAFLRRWFSNAHWLGPDLVRTNQPSPRQLAYWKSQGVKTVINLRGERDEAYYALEKDACERLGLTLIDAPLDSRDPPQKDRVHRARRAVPDDRISGADPLQVGGGPGRDDGGLLSPLPSGRADQREAIEAAVEEIPAPPRGADRGAGLHAGEIPARGRADGVSFLDWIDSDAYDPKAIRAEFKAGWWGTVLTEKLLRRE